MGIFAPALTRAGWDRIRRVFWPYGQTTWGAVFLLDPKRTCGLLQAARVRT